MASSPVFATIPRISSVSISSADSSYTAPTGVGTLITAASNGTRIAEVVIKNAATSASGVIRTFLHDGSTYYLFDETLVTPATGSATVAQSRVSTTYNNLIIPSGYSLRVTTSVAQITHVTALGADL